MRNKWRDAGTFSPEVENLYEVLAGLQMIDHSERFAELG